MACGVGDGSRAGEGCNGDLKDMVLLRLLGVEATAAEKGFEACFSGDGAEETCRDFVGLDCTACLGLLSLSYSLYFAAGALYQHRSHTSVEGDPNQ